MTDAAYLLRLTETHYSLYGGTPDTTQANLVRSGRIERAPKWVRVILAIARARGVQEPIWACLDGKKNLVSIMETKINTAGSRTVTAYWQSLIWGHTSGTVIVPDELIEDYLFNLEK